MPFVASPCFPGLCAKQKEDGLFQTVQFSSLTKVLNDENVANVAINYIGSGPMETAWFDS